MKQEELNLILLREVIVKMELETETGKTVINCLNIKKDDGAYFVNLPELGYNNIRLSEKSCERIITGYIRPKKESK